jgi:hypothetical protein
LKLRVCKIYPLLVGIVILAAQNILIFYNHYFNGYAFPWDFLGSYHALPYYWIEALKQGVDIAWIPFQGMGYPLFLNLQSGVFYPPFWLFVLFGKIYTVEAAVLMQGLHVLFGAGGAVTCARLLGMGWKESLLAGVFYQGFGAFYSNAEHPDIVRTYALLPWLCAPVFAQWQDRSVLLRTGILLLPLWTYGLWTGGYPGGAIAAMFVLGSTLLVRILIDRNNRNIGMLVLVALITGCLLAGVSVLPAMLGKSEIARVFQVNGLSYDYLSASDVFALIYNVDNLFFGHDISMRSLFVSVPVVALLLFGVKNCRQWNAWLMLSGFLAIAMASGILHKHIISIFPQLGYSRYTLADYRGFIGLVLILLAVQGGIAGQVEKDRRNYLWSVVLLLFALVGNFMLQLNRPDNWRDFAMLVLIMVAVIVVLGAVWHRKKDWVIPLLMVITLLDWSRVQWNQRYFLLPDGNAQIEANIGKLVDSRKTLTARLQGNEGCRPQRTDISESEPLKKPERGYYTGDYMMEDYSGPMKFLRQQQILTSLPLRAFVGRSWMAVNVPDASAFEDSLLVERSPSSVSCIRYGTTRIEYRVELSQPQFVVENELFWKGWSAQMFGVDGASIGRLSPEDVKGFRGWHLPAGSYTLVAAFETPNKNVGMLVTATGALTWIGLGWLLLRRSTRKPIL